MVRINSPDIFRNEISIGGYHWKSKDFIVEVAKVGNEKKPKLKNPRNGRTCENLACARRFQMRFF